MHITITSSGEQKATLLVTRRFAFLLPLMRGVSLIIQEKKMKYFVVFTLLVISIAAHAEKWHVDKVKMLYPLAAGNFVVSLQDFPAECTNASQYFYVEVGQRSVTSEGANKMFSLAMMALASDKILSVNYDETSSNFYINRMYISQ
jgi:hypothetical protein